MNCPDIDSLLNALDDRDGEVAAHVQSCTSCQALTLAALDVRSALVPPIVVPDALIRSTVRAMSEASAVESRRSLAAAAATFVLTAASVGPAVAAGLAQGSSSGLLLPVGLVAAVATMVTMLEPRFVQG